MPKKRKSRKQKKSGFKTFFFIIIALLAAFALYSYQTDTEFKAQVSEASESVIEKAQELIPQSDSDKEKSVPEESQKKYDFLIELSKGLEEPFCPALHAGEDHEIRRFENYSICYRESYEQAEWSAYCLTEEELVKKAKRSDDFREDPCISTGSATPADYKKSGYDRGHLSPAADFAFSEKAMSETFYMSNMSPQKGSLNRGLWKDLESKVREWAKEFGRVYVVSGPVLEKPAAEYKAIGENQVSVPEFYYKVILAPLYADEDDKASPEDAQNIMMMAYIFPNEKCEGTLDDYAVTVDEVEKRTGLDFFAPLPDSIENEMEGKVKR